VVVSLSLALGACGGKPYEEQSCTDMACSSSVSLTGLDLGTVSEVLVCGAGRCVTRAPTVEGAVGFALPEDVSGGDGGEVEVQVTLLLGDGTEVAGPAADLPLTPYFPNGEDCPPPCWQAAAQVAADGTLTPADPDIPEPDRSR
jgi:hypothetical protein